MHPSHSRFRRLCLPLLAAAALVLAGATSASARGLQVKITSPAAGATVAGDFRIKAKIRKAGRRHTVSYYVDGRLVARQRRGRAARASRSAHVRTAKLSGGRHNLRVVVRAGRKRATSRVRINVKRAKPQKSVQRTAATSAASTPAAGEDLSAIAPTISDDPAVPTTDANDFRLIFADDFTKDAALGSFASDCDAGKIVYTGTSGTKWRAYPRCFKDTYQKRPYRSDQVLSVHDGALDFWLHNVDGQPAGANPSPVINGDSQYQTYGRYSARVKVDATDLSEYYMAWLLWPSDESKWDSAESDFPERSLGLGSGVTGWHHSAGGNEPFGNGSVDMRQWHTYTQDWTPLVRRYYIDGRLIYTTLNQVYQGAQRWQLQTETNGFGNNSGHLLVDWVAVYSYAPSNN